jgi:lipoate-protein ligase A
MPRRWRLVDSGLVPSAESAALDEAILEAHVQGAVPGTLHFYRRSVPTVSIGYFQKVADSVDLLECQRRGVSIVRRKSGGSSIYTDSGQLIYGLVIDGRDVPEGESAFSIICEAIARALSSFGVDARYRPPNDVEVGGRKLSGNAQLMRKGSVLQHGTVIVDTDLATMDAVLKLAPVKDRKVAKPSDRVTTLKSLLGRVPYMVSIKNSIAKEISETLDAEFKQDDLTDGERGHVKRLVAERYSRDGWNMKL